MKNPNRLGLRRAFQITLQMTPMELFEEGDTEQRTMHSGDNTIFAHNRHEVDRTCNDADKLFTEQYQFKFRFLRLFRYFAEDKFFREF